MPIFECGDIVYHHMSHRSATIVLVRTVSDIGAIYLVQPTNPFYPNERVWWWARRTALGTAAAK